MKTIAENIEAGLSEKNKSVSKIEGYQEGLWVLVDAYEVVAHVFYRDIRKFYNLEGLWGDAPRIKLCHKKKKIRSKKTLVKKSKNFPRFMK